MARLKQAGLLHEFADAHMRRSGFFSRYQTLGDADLVRQAWTDAAAGIDHIIDA